MIPGKKPWYWRKTRDEEYVMEQRIDELLGNLYEKTQSLALLVEKKDSDVDEWMGYLDEREQLMQDIQALVQEGFIFTADQKEQLLQMSEINARILPQMDLRKQELTQKIGNIQQNKAVRQFYNSEGPSGYGAFFDQKK